MREAATRGVGELMSARHRHVKKKIRALEESLKARGQLLSSYADVITHISHKGFMSHAPTLLELAVHVRNVRDECEQLRGELANLEKTLAAMPKRLESAA